ncbi:MULTISPECIES: hypothetical protein [Pseudoalteromonas]|uniref:Uncharacterized protein n=1 Tax=Pseudoalteromonas amylolytica TaxID=1859457 RepID=A0A1S1MLN7_9GAMM|nr:MULTISPECIES: hypothetical protein [Pseudoalteromonas]OHU86793.1 hypothetical protein BFC16_14960 [Pseudoalteromonas sp. JW3]OHU88682.1 hypothetical protein BET10_17795 [Pseudoalteromonas amylolytica]
MNSLKTLIQVFGAATLLTLAGCSDGPAEETGEEVDEMITDAQNAVEDACENLKEAAKAENENC